MPWLVFEAPNLSDEGHVPSVHALYFFNGTARRAWRLEAGGDVAETPQLIPSFPVAPLGAIDQLAQLADGSLADHSTLMKTLEYEGKVYARSEGKVYCFDGHAAMPEFKEVAELPPRIVKLAGGGLGILDVEA